MIGQRAKRPASDKSVLKPWYRLTYISLFRDSYSVNPVVWQEALSEIIPTSALAFDTALAETDHTLPLTLAT